MLGRNGPHNFFKRVQKKNLIEYPSTKKNFFLYDIKFGIFAIQTRLIIFRKILKKYLFSKKSKYDIFTNRVFKMKKIYHVSYLCI